MSIEKKYYCRPASEFVIDDLEKELRSHGGLLDDYEMKLFEIVKDRIDRIGAQAFLTVVRWMKATGWEDPGYFYNSLLQDDTCLTGQFDDLTAAEAWDAIVCRLYTKNKLAQHLYLEAKSLMHEICEALSRLRFTRDDIKDDKFLDDLFDLLSKYSKNMNNDFLDFVFDDSEYETYGPKDREWICEKIRELILS